MKTKALIFCAILFAWGSAWSQGRVYFANVAAGLNAPVYFSNTLPPGPMALCFGPEWVADLWFGPAGTMERDLTPLHQPATFLTGAQAGYFIGGARTIPGVPGGAEAVLQVRVWNLNNGATWEEAINRPGYGKGVSSLLNVTLTSLPATPALLTGLTSFWAYRMPEPTSGALLVVGGLVFWWRRRMSRGRAGTMRRTR